MMITRCDMLLFFPTSLRYRHNTPYAAAAATPLAYAAPLLLICHTCDAVAASAEVFAYYDYAIFAIDVTASAAADAH